MFGLKDIPILISVESIYVIMELVRDHEMFQTRTTFQWIYHWKH